MTAVAAGSAPALVEAIRAREGERQSLQAKLEHLDGLGIEAEQFDVVAWLDETKELLEDVRFTLESEPAASRQLLRRMLVGPITVTPGVDGEGRRVFTFAGKATYGELHLAAGQIRPVRRDVAGRLPRHVQQ